MNFQYLLYIIMLIIGVLSLILFLWMYKRDKNALGSKIGIIMILCCLIWISGETLQFLNESLQIKILWNKLEYIGIAAVPLIYLFIVLINTGYEGWITTKKTVLLSVIPFLTLIFVFTNDLHGLFWKNTVLDNNLNILVHEYGLWYWIWIAYLYTVIIVTHYILIRILVSRFNIFRIQSAGIISILSIPWLANTVHNIGFKNLNIVDITPLSLIISISVIIFGFNRLKIIDIVPIAREAICDSIKDNIIVLDSKNRILYLNHSAKKILKNYSSSFMGKHVAEILTDCRNYFKNLSEIHVKSSDIILGSKKGKKEYRMIVSPIFFNYKIFIGRVILLRDITNQNKMNRSLHYRIRFENLIATLSKSFINLELDNIDDGINDALKEIGKFTKIDNVYVCIFKNCKIKTGKTYEWCNKSVNPQLTNIKELYSAKIPLLKRKLNKLETIQIPDISAIEKKTKRVKGLLKSLEIKSIITVPMIYNESLIGYLGLDSIKEKRIWTEDDVKLLKIVGDIFTNILERKQAEEEVRYLLLKDKLTGLYNRAYFEEELKRLDTKRQLPLSFIIGDVNGLKLVNDAFSPKEGDRILRKTANILQSCCRKEDIIARWGGDEFSILLPNTTEKNSEVIINRIREKCQKTTDQKIPLSISLGTSTKRDYKCNIKTIIKEAEDRMYSRKLLERDSISSSIISSLETTLQEKSYETEEHAIRLRKMAMLLGHALKLPDNKLNELSLLSTLHDIGKIAIPDEILTKKGKLTEKEWEIIKKHPEIGYNISSSSPQLTPISIGILSHHEYWNGDGYPRGLSGDKIPVESRIITIVDAYDVMTHDRCYKKAVSRKEAIEELQRCAGTQFDPLLVKIFTQVLAKNKNPELSFSITSALGYSTPRGTP